MSNKKGPLWKSFYHAFCGIFTNILKERNLRIHLVIMLMVILFGFILKISTIEWIICLILFGMVISLELVNTAIETTIDIYVDKFNDKAKLAKDTAAGAVLVSAIVSIIIGLIIFIPKFLLVINNFIK